MCDRTSQQQVPHYRALSSAAVVSLVCGVCSPVVLLAAGTGFEAFLLLFPIPLLGIAFGLRARAAIRRLPGELTGLRLAAAGTTLSGLFLVTALALATYVYATEVPAAYTRISYARLRPSQRDIALGKAVPEDIVQLDGQRVFIKGYMRPSSQMRQLDQFLLVRDNNQCCFGAINKVRYFDRILVRTVDSVRVDYRRGVLRVGGILHVAAQNAVRGPGYAVFHLDVDYVK